MHIVYQILTQIFSDDISREIISYLDIYYNEQLCPSYYLIKLVNDSDEETSFADGMSIELSVGANY